MIADPGQKPWKEYERFEKAKKNGNPKPEERENVIQGIRQGKTAWSLVYDLGVSIRAVRKISEDIGIPIKYDRRPADKSQGENFPFSFYIREANE